MNQRQISFTLLLAFGLFCFGGLAAVPATAEPPKGDGDSESPAEANSSQPTARSSGAKQWKSMTDHWEVCRFGGEGPVKIEDDLITLGYGDPMTGVRWTGEVPRKNYELRMEARRTEGFDFFCGTTFPVGEKGKCSLILGGWGGGVLGLSSIDGQDASTNATTQFKVFDNDQWYKIRIRVDSDKIKCWIDGKVWVEQPRGDHEFDIRYEMDPTLPLGLANYQCRSEIRNIQIRRLENQSAEPSPGAEQGEAEQQDEAAVRDSGDEPDDTSEAAAETKEQ